MRVQKQLAAQAIDAFLRALGQDPDRDPDLRGTGARVADAWANDLLDGYEVDIPALLAGETIEGVDAASADPAMLVVRGISTATICPHHLLPAWGTADVVYRPGKALLGLGVVARLVHAFSHRLTLQESIGQNVVRSLVEYGHVRGAGCRLSLSHTCMTLRGARQVGSTVETLSFAGSWGEAGSERDVALAALEGHRVARAKME